MQEVNLSKKIASSYPTYEEWKLCSSAYSVSQSFRSYPTYEEWKHGISSSNKL